MSRPTVLIAPVTVTPAKPLTPSHLKGLLWTDVLVRATGLLADVTYRSSHTAYHPCEQTLGFWEFLDRTLGDTDYATASEAEIGELYVKFRAAEQRAPFAAQRPYLDAIERSGWVHPASVRILELWSDHYARLGMCDPGLLEHQPPGISFEHLVFMLAAEGLCVDLRVHGGPVYVDATRFGLPLRQIMSADGRPNYLACALRDLVPLAPKHDETVLLYDRELEPDYLLLHRVLAQLGATVWRVPIGRVPIDGRITSARHGGWHDHAAAALLDAAGGFDDAALRLGMRLYFIAMLGPGSTDSFRHELLHRWLNRAGRLLAGISGRGRAPAEVVAAHRGEHAYVDPYRLTASLLNRHREQPGSDLLREVFHAEPGSVAGPGDPPDRRGAPGADRPVHHR